MNYLVIDTETTGLNTLWDEPIQIAVGKLTPRGFEVEVFWSQTERKIDAAAAAVHGITPEFLAQKGMPPALAAKRYNDILWHNQPCTLVGYNFLNFDFPIIQNWLARKIPGRFKFSPSVGIKDVMFLCCNHFKERKWPKLSVAAERLGVESDETMLHDAKYDVELTWEIFKILEVIE